MKEQPKTVTGAPGNALGIGGVSQSCDLPHDSIGFQADGGSGLPGSFHPK